MGKPDSASAVLSPPQLHASRYVVARVRAEVDADLVQASLFGSRARGGARPDSDVDILLVFRQLPPDREPQATHAERIAAEEAERHRVPVSVWSVSLIDLALGNRTPMLVDALADSIPLWSAAEPLDPVVFTPRDALGCVSALLCRVEEGSDEVRRYLERGAFRAAARRLRDDVVRLCTGRLLLAGITRPRRAAAVRVFSQREPPTAELQPLLAWAERSFGDSGTDEKRPVDQPPGGMVAGAWAVETLRLRVARRAKRMRGRLERPQPPPKGEGREWSLRSGREADAA